MNIDLKRMRDCLQQFEFHQLFIEEMGWSQPTHQRPVAMTVLETSFTRRQIAQLAAVPVFEISSTTGTIPDAKTRAAVHKEIVPLHHENLLIFIDAKRTKSLWYWTKRQTGKILPRPHEYVKGQPGDLFLSKLKSIVFDIWDFDEPGNVSVVTVAERFQKAFDIEPVTKKFYAQFYEQHLEFVELIQGIEDEQQRRWYASVLLNRLMFIYFLQRKGFLDGGDLDYLQNKLARSQQRGLDHFFKDFLKPLFFEGFAKPEDLRAPETNGILGTIPYLDGGLFLPHAVEQNNKNLDIPDAAFSNLFALFRRFSWNLNDTPGGQDDEINPDVLGYIFEKYINQKAFGAYYTRTEITEYLCEQTIHRLILNAVNSPKDAEQNPLPGEKIRNYDSIGDLLTNLDAPLCRKLLFEVLPKLKLLDPACGSGAFLVAAMKTLIKVYSAIVGAIKFLNDRTLSDWLKGIEDEHKSLNYFIKKTIITDNLYGVDIMEEATEIAKLRLFLALVAAAEDETQLEPLPNIDFNILCGNSLIGLMRVDDAVFKKHVEDSLFRKSYRQLLKEKNILIDAFRHATSYAQDLVALRDEIQKKKEEALPVLDQILLDEFEHFKIKYEQATWDFDKHKPGKPKKRPVQLEDIQALQPFHWGYEFDEILNHHGGFDAIITNPPWEIFKPNAKEFFESYSDAITKKKMTIKAFQQEQAKLLQDPDIFDGWLDYLSDYPHVSAFLRTSPQYKNQISIVNGRKAGSDINLYKLFTEQCFNLLRPGGECGIVIPSGIYTDLGTKQLREMLFDKTQITGLFCFENRKTIFEGVDSRFKFVVLTYQKDANTTSFPAAFMRHDVAELAHFPEEGAIEMSVDLIRKLSPDSLSVMEFKSDLDVELAKKMLRFPLLGQHIEGAWNPRLTREFDMTNDSHLFKTEPGPGRLPLYEGKMIWHFDPQFEKPRYWVDDKEGRKVVLGHNNDDEHLLDYQAYRLGFRDIASNTNERTMVSSIIPSTFHGNKIPTVKIFDKGKRLLSESVQLLLCSIWNSYVIDFMIRMKVTTTLNFFYIYQLPVPRLTEKDSAFMPIVERAAKLICTTPEFDELAKEVGLGSHKNGVTDRQERAALRAELDGMVAHLYGLSEDEFAHILSTFPLVEDAVKEAALDAYRTLAPKAEAEHVAALIASGESASVEFKSSARWDMRQNQQNKAIEGIIVKTVAAFLNTEGGTLLIGVDDEGNVLGLDHDYQTLGKKAGRDGYENWLTTRLLNEFGKDASPLIRIIFHDLNDKECCQVAVSPSNKPRFVKDGHNEILYIRTGNATRQLTISEALDYAQQRWE